MRAYEVLTEKEINELKIVDRMLHAKSLRTGYALYRNLLGRDMEPDEALRQAAQMANVGDKELQLYIKDHQIVA